MVNIMIGVLAGFIFYPIIAALLKKLLHNIKN